MRARVAARDKALSVRCSRVVGAVLVKRNGPMSRIVLVREAHDVLQRLAAQALALAHAPGQRVDALGRKF
eukprot:6179240-Pleurochrysis_carterae.AAC.3